MARHEQHSTALVVNQVVEVRQERALGGEPAVSVEDDLPSAERKRVGVSVHKQYGDPSDPYWHPFRPDALLTPEMLHHVYARNADVRSVFNSIERRISTWDHDFLPALDEDDPDYEKAVAQAKAVTKWFDGPLNLDGDTWQIFWTMVVHDALKLWHGVFEHVHREVVDAAGVKKRGFLVEFVPLYGGSVYPVPGDRRRVGGYVQDLGYDGTVRTQDKLIELPARDITRLQLDPNTRSLFGTPLIETAVIQIGTLDRSSNRVFEEFDSELPVGFLIMSGGETPVAKAIGGEKKGRHHGKDSKLKILYQKGQTAPAKWMTLQRAWKELELAPVVKQAQKTWWRLCGVTPADMGDVEDANRSNMDAQLDVSSSHLIDPLLEGIQSVVNSRMVPLVVQMLAQDRNARVLCKFEFDLTTKLTPKQFKDLEEARDKQVRNGTRTANELRAEDGEEPYDGGEVFRHDGQVVGSTDGETDPDPDPDDGDGGDGDGGGERAAPTPEPTPPPETPEAREEPPTPPQAPPQAVAAQPEHVHGPGCGHVLEEPSTDLGARRQASHRHDRVATLLSQAAVVGAGASVSDLRKVAGAGALRWNLQVREREPEQLPSDWQPAGRFEDDNTIDLLALFGQVTGYGGVVQPLWDAARAQSLAATAAAFQRGEVGSPLHRDALNQVLAKLQEDWARSTSEIYDETAVSARDAVREFTGEDGLGETKVDNLADLFADVAMGFLAALMASLDERMERAIAILEGNPDAELDELLSEMERGWDANEHRIDNWSGRLVQLANQAAVATLLEASTLVTDEEGTTREDPYYVRWFDVGDERECPDCIEEASRGWHTVQTLTRVPGGATQCRSRDRCVLGFARKSEVV